MLLALAAGALLAACGDAGEQPAPLTATLSFQPSPTVIAAAPTQTPDPAGPTLTPSPTLPPTVTPLDTAGPPPASATPSATPTLGPYEHVIKAGEFCLGIAAQYGHTSPDVKAAIEALNGIANCAILPGPGTVILIPRPTATATPEGLDLTQTAVATAAPPMVTLAVQSSFSVQSYAVQQDDTLSSIALRFDSTLRQLCELNPAPGGIDCGHCRWESPHCCCPGGVSLSVGQQVNVPAPTPTPTFTSTFTGSETPTYTPTFRAPQEVFPAHMATVSGPVRLSWVSVGPLAADQFYLVTLRDETGGAVFNAETRQLSVAVPRDYLPADGPRSFVWQVSVVRQGADGLLYPVGPAMPERQFTWRGWE